MKYAGNTGFATACRTKLRSRKGLTLTELLAAVVVLGMLGLILGGGMMMVKNAYQKTQERADAEQALALTAQLMTDEFANALDVKNSAGGSEDSQETVAPLIQSGNSHLWLRFDASDVKGTGIARVYGEYGGEAVPLMTQEMLSKGYVTAFDSCTYSEENKCFTVNNLSVYRKKDIRGTSRTPLIKPLTLTVYAVNLDKNP